MTLDDFCTKLSGLPLSQPEQALAILWFHDEKQPDVVMSAGYQFSFCDAASVMLRRLVETLIIEAYETLTREADIKDGTGNYYMLRELITRACDTHPIGLGRDAKDALKQIKELGDRSAH